MRTKRSIRRDVRYYVGVAVKFLFLFGMGVQSILEGSYRLAYYALSGLGLRFVLDYLVRRLERLDDWLRRRSNWFAFSIVGFLCVIGIVVFYYKGYLLLHLEFRKWLWVEIAEKFGYAVVFEHLWHVYRDRLLAYRFIKVVYEKSIATWMATLTWVRESDTYVDAMIWIEDCRLRARYSFFGHLWRAARTHRCCLPPRFI